MIFFKFIFSVVLWLVNQGDYLYLAWLSFCRAYSESRTEEVRGTKGFNNNFLEEADCSQQLDVVKLRIKNREAQYVWA